MLGGWGARSTGGLAHLSLPHSSCCACHPRRSLAREREGLQKQQEALLETLQQQQALLEAAAAAPPSRAQSPPSSQHVAKLLRDQKEALEAQYEATLTVGTRMGELVHAQLRVQASCWHGSSDATIWWIVNWQPWIGALSKGCPPSPA